MFWWGYWYETIMTLEYENFSDFYWCENGTKNIFPLGTEYNTNYLRTGFAMKLVRKVFVPEHDCVFVPFTPLKQYVGQKYVGIQSTKSPMCQNSCKKLQLYWE